MLVLVRHGETEANAAKLLSGRAESPLTDRGRAQAAALGAVLGGAARVVSSPLARARESAVALGLGVGIEVDDRWVEIDYGEYDGRALASVSDDVWRRWRAEAGFRPPGGESLADVGARVRAACTELFAVAGAGARGEADVVVVSH
ncbi:MAG: histidine phosphatase family protein, partial [Acidimicrobiales bacterium]